MPNHFTTVGLCSRDYDRLESLGKDDFSEIDLGELKNKNLCEIVMKIPDEMKRLALAYEWAIDNWGTKWGTYETRVHELGGDGSPILIEFQSAWCPPNGETMRKITEYLRETYCLNNIKWIGHEPYDGSLVDVDAYTQSANCGQHDGFANELNAICSQVRKNTEILSSMIADSGR